MGPRSREFLARSPTRTSPTPPSRSATARARSTSAMAFVRAARDHLRRRAGLGAVRPDRVRDPRLRHDRRRPAAGFGLRHAGYHALNSLRIEKAYRHWGHDISDEDTLLEAGLGFTAAWDKPGGFIGREALLRQREAGRPAAPRRVHARRPGTAPVPQRADLAGRHRWSGGSPRPCSATRSGDRSASATSSGTTGRSPPSGWRLGATRSRSQRSGSLPAPPSGRPTTQATRGSGGSRDAGIQHGPRRGHAARSRPGGHRRRRGHRRRASPTTSPSSAGRDVVLLERRQLTAGTTWHAAGLITSAGMATETPAVDDPLHPRPVRVARGRDRPGDRLSGRSATSTSRRRRSGSRRSAARRRSCAGSAWTTRRSRPPSSGGSGRPRRPTTCWPRSTSPTRAGSTRPTSRWPTRRAPGMGGARIVEGVTVTGVTTARGRVTGVVTDHGTIAAEFVVNAAGHVGARGRRAGRRLRAAPGGRALLPDHRHRGVGPSRTCRSSRTRTATATTARRAAGSSSACSSRSPGRGRSTASRPTSRSPACRRTGTGSGRT